MGQTIRRLSEGKLKGGAVFNNRMVVESCEDFHFHYRNLRINISPADWSAFAKGFSDSYLRWEKMGRPMGGHTELCRKRVATNSQDKGVEVNLNRNLYKANEGSVFSEGTDLKDEEYIHLKIRDMRLEMTKEEFRIFADTVWEASCAMEDNGDDAA